MRTINLLTKALLAVALFIAFSCQKDEVDEALISGDISGVVQKGPFNVGTTVTLSELNEDFTQTGKTFTAQINSDDGLFQLSGVQLSSSYVELKADGFYFDEISGENSSAKLTLCAIADVNEKSTLNINVLTHLEKPRVEYLLANGYSFAEAKEKAKLEVLEVFKLSVSGSSASETLDITKSGTENACLLAISSIVQGYRSVADVSELLTYIANDLEEDGILNDSGLKTSLISHALFIDAALVRQNVSNKYSGLGETVQVPEFGQYLDQFISTSSYAPVNLIVYPEQSTNGLNILNAGNSVFDAGFETSYSMAVVPVKGIHTKIELRLLEYSPDNFTIAWGYSSNTTNWSATAFDAENKVQTFEVTDSGQPADLRILFFSPGMKIQIKYFEGSRESTREIIIN